MLYYRDKTRVQMFYFLSGLVEFVVCKLFDRDTCVNYWTHRDTSMNKFIVKALNDDKVFKK